MESPHSSCAFAVCCCRVPSAGDATDGGSEHAFLWLCLQSFDEYGMKCTGAPPHPPLAHFAHILSFCWHVDDGVESRTSCASGQPAYTGLSSSRKKYPFITGASPMTVNYLQANCLTHHAVPHSVCARVDNEHCLGIFKRIYTPGFCLCLSCYIYCSKEFLLLELGLCPLDFLFAVPAMGDLC